MFSVPSYPRSDRYYSHKGQVIRRRRMDTPAPLSPQQLQQAYDYFVARSILSPPTPPPDTNIYLFYGPTTSDEISNKQIVHISDFPPAPTGSSSLSTTTYDLFVVAIILTTDPSRIYFYSFYTGSSSSRTLRWESPYSVISLFNRNAGLSLSYRAGITFMQYLLYLPIDRNSTTVTISYDFLATLPYITVIGS